VSAIQAAAIREWWAKRKAAGWSKPRISAAEKKRRERERKATKFAENPDKYRALSLKSYYANHEANKAKKRRKYAERAEFHRANDKARRLKNIDIVREQERARYARNPTRALAINTRWRAKNKERTRANARRRDALKAKTRIGPVDYRDILAASNGLCGICGSSVDTSNPKAYHYDHIVPLSRGGGHVQENLQLAHAKCNMKKHARIA
jgi:5-methylcytosine-specific restriction endonuclease McrA